MVDSEQLYSKVRVGMMTFGRVLFLIGIIGFIGSLAVFLVVHNFAGVVCGFFGIVIALPALVLGAILYFIGKSLEEKKTDLCKTPDSQSGNSDKIDRL